MPKNVNLYITGDILHTTVILLIKVCALVKLIREAANAKKGFNPNNP